MKSSADVDELSIFTRHTHKHCKIDLLRVGENPHTATDVQHSCDHLISLCLSVTPNSCSPGFYI